MNKSLKRLTFLILAIGMAAPIHSQSRADSKTVRKTEKLTINGKNLREVIRETKDVSDDKYVHDDKDAHDGEYWFNRGYSMHQSSHYIEAIEAFSHSIGLGHRQATCMYNVACGYSKLNDKENALFWLERSISSGFDRADLLKQDSDLDPLRSDPRFREILQKATPVKRETDSKDKGDKKRDRLDEAIINFEQLNRTSSNDGDQWYKVGSRLLSLRDFERAIAALTQAVDHLGFRGASAMYNLACTYALKGDTEQGLKWLEQSVNAGFDSVDKFREDPDIVSLRDDPRFKKIQELARVLSLSQFGDDNDSNDSKRQWTTGVKHFQSFLKQQPNNGRGWFNLGFSLHYAGQHAKAIEAFERAIQLNYKQPTSLYNIACANAMMGNRDVAFEYLEKSVRAGFNIEDYAAGDQDLESLRSDPRFKRYLDVSDEKHKEKHK